MKIISGGQTGVDRAALDVAMKHGIECGGWCPTGRIDEYGRIPARYPLQELKAGGFAERTLRNVKDSEGTVVIYEKKLSGGSRRTVQFCRELRRPYALIDGAMLSPGEAVMVIARFIRKASIVILNIAGPRESEWRDGYAYAFSVLENFVTTRPDQARSKQ